MAHKLITLGQNQRRPIYIGFPIPSGFSLISSIPISPKSQSEQKRQNLCVVFLGAKWRRVLAMAPGYSELAEPYWIRSNPPPELPILPPLRPLTSRRPRSRRRSWKLPPLLPQNPEQRKRSIVRRGSSSRSKCLRLSVASSVCPRLRVLKLSSKYGPTSSWIISRLLPFLSCFSWYDLIFLYRCASSLFPALCSSASLRSP